MIQRAILNGEFLCLCFHAKLFTRRFPSAAGSDDVGDRAGSDTDSKLGRDLYCLIAADV